MFTRHTQRHRRRAKTFAMPRRLTRCYGAGYMHFVTTSCYERRPLLGSGGNRDLFLQVLEQVRRRYRFVVVGYLVMPEHVHLLISEPERGDPSIVMQVVKQSFARRLLRESPPFENREGWGSLGLDDRHERSDGGLGDERHVWQVRFYDFVVFTEAKKVEKLRYMHRNPVKRGLVREPQEWAWSSFRHYAYGEAGPVLVNEQLRAEMKVREVG
jgi:putative transposase